MLQLTNAGVLLLLSLDRHTDHVEEFRLLILQTQIARRLSLPTVHFDLLDRLPSLVIDGLPVVEAGAHHVAQAHLGITEQTDFEIAVGGYSQPVAAAAEVVRHACYEADSSLETRDLEGLARIIWMVLYLLHVWMSFPYDGQHLLIAKHLLRRPLVTREGHVFNKPYFKVLVFRHLHEWQDLVIVEATYDDGVDLEFEPYPCFVHLQDTCYALHYLLKPSSSCHDLKLERI